MNEGSSQADTSTTQTQTSQSSASPASAVASATSGGSQTTDTSSTSATQTTDNTVDLAKLLGDEYSKDPMFKDFKDIKDLAKSFKETKSMVGKPRFDIPGQDAPPEQVTEFYKKLGVPETADAYELKPDANVPEHNNELNVNFLKAFGNTAHELKLTKDQAVGMQKFFDDLTVNMGKEAATKQAEEDSQLDSLLTKAVGGDKNVAAEAMKQDLEKVLPKEMRELLTDKVSNEALVAMTLLKRHYEKQFGQSDTTVGDEGSTSGKSIADMRKEAQDLMSTKEYRNPMDPGHKATKEKVDAMYKSIGELTNAAQKK